MLLFWVVAGLLAAAAAGLILIRAAGAAGLADSDDPALSLYRRQLSELDDLADRGLLGETEKRSAHAEAARRLLAATESAPAPWRSDAGSRGLVLLAALAVPVLALLLYLKVGAVGTPDQPYAQRLAGWQRADLRTLSAPEIAAVLRKATSERPTEAEGFRLLGLAESASQNPIAAIRAFKRAAALAPDRVDLWQLLGEAQVAAAGGKVDADAQATFRRLLALQPGEPAARFFLARAKAAAGDRAAAQADLGSLLADLPASDQRRGAVQEELARLENKPNLGADPQQMAMIRGMVAGLAARLDANPDDPDGWVRLVRAYAVLGETAKRDAAYASARARYAAKPAVLDQLDQAARAETMR
ncbi:MAG: c-type cytochrome biogenesis protein CcmI [Caulobacterales bacterium]|nr:c-type cytochrome biogenesis protein CcmI [Caulobacterales bacterium]